MKKNKFFKDHKSKLMERVLLAVMLLISYTMSAQLTIDHDAEFSVTGDLKLALHNTDLINNGNFTALNSDIRCSGNVTSNISGSQLVQFSELTIDKTDNSSLILKRTIGVSQRIFFSSGFLDLNGFDIDLGSTAHLEDEREDSHVTGANGGQVIASRILNAPGFENPGNLGAIISSPKNLGNVIIKRGHQSQSGVGLDKSILRYYDIIPVNNIDLNSVLQLSYLDAELNGVDENALVFFKSDDGTNWTEQGVTSGNTGTNFIDKDQIESFSRWTLSGGNNRSTVHFILFNATCDGNKIQLTWKTAQEQNSSRFDIERSVDGVRWIVIGDVPAAGNSNSERTYSFADNNPGQDNFYRIAHYDVNRRGRYTNVLRPACGKTEIFNLWPNPAHDAIFINIVTSNESPVIIKVFDAKGALVKIQKNHLLPGSNQLKVDLVSLPGGAYSVQADWGNSQIKKFMKMIKR